MRVLILTLALIGCQTYEIDEVNGPDGAMQEATCYEGMRDCMNAAAEFCGGKYQIIGRDEGDSGAVLMPMGNSAVVATYSEDRMYFRCGGEDSSH